MPGQRLQEQLLAENRQRGRLFYGWYIIAASFVILFFNSGARYAFGVMMKPIIAEFGWSRGTVSAGEHGFGEGKKALTVILQVVAIKCRNNKGMRYYPLPDQARNFCQRFKHNGNIFLIV